MKRHIDCGWLIFDKTRRRYKCCDARSSLAGRMLEKEEVEKEACRHFHVNKHPSFIGGGRMPDSEKDSSAMDLSGE